jgi:hypothetical protein
VLLGLGTLSGAGAAAGTALTGAVDGTAVTGVDQALVLDDDTAVNVNGANDSVTTVSADGTRFRAASQVTQGEQYEVELLLRNRADVNLAGELLLAVDEPLQISATGGEFAQIQRVAKNRFILAVSRFANGTDGATAPNTVTLTIAVPNGADPGFYEIKGEIVTGTRSSAAFNRLTTDVTRTFTEPDVSVTTSGSATVSDGAVTLGASTTTVSRPSDEEVNAEKDRYGLSFTPKIDLSKITMTVSSQTSGESTVYVTDTNRTILASEPSPGAGNSVTLDVTLTADTDYYAVVDNGGNEYTLGIKGDLWGEYPYGSNTNILEINAGIHLEEGGTTSFIYGAAYGIKSLTAPAAAGEATIEWNEPQSVSRWERAVFDAERNGGELDVYVETSSDGGTNWSDWDRDGDGSAEPIEPVTDLSSISSTDRVRFRAELISKSSNKPRLERLLRQWRP